MDADEEALRLQNFHASLSIVEEHNAKDGQSWWMGLNQFSDMSDEEFKQKVSRPNPRRLSVTPKF